MNPTPPRTTKSERIELRATPDEATRIALAAQLQHLSISAFVLQAAAAEADRVTARSEFTLMPADQFDELMASLDQPPEIPALARAAARRRAKER
ncbi:DUF1778 domain-containing protein [Dactylosporangium vinaceum]|uniref:DUF1778 domain-containing protein n=1 Tax=Dactylosporangium vinaceum TaxID=53362 RepID=A0ABV5MLP5_9ACTN|nr:DUF1778 domain-containing protein [Dactylosporangium vinaceum]UAB96904.1 DUF1778 domain-containing protein [Dactylosporangium vinaceum]